MTEQNLQNETLVGSKKNTYKLYISERIREKVAAEVFAWARAPLKMQGACRQGLLYQAAQGQL